jgi:outer membrane protein
VQTHFIVLAALFVTAPCWAQADGPAREAGLGSVIMRMRAVGVVPQDSSSNTTRLGGNWVSTDSAGLDFDASIFVTHNIALSLGASTTQHKFALIGTSFGAVPVGSARLIVPSLTVQYHFQPDATFRPYVGVGPAAAVLIDPRPGGTLVDTLYFDSQVGVAFQAGMDISLGGPFVLNADIKQLLVRTTAYSPHPPRVPVRANVHLNPTIVGLGMGYRF